MLQRIILVIIIIITLGVTAEESYLNLLNDNSVEGKDVKNIAKIENEIANASNDEVNVIESHSNSVDEKKQNKKDDSEANYIEKKEKNIKTEVNKIINVTDNTNVNKENTEQENKKEEKEETNSEKDEQKLNSIKKEEVEDVIEKEENKTKEPIYNQSETNRMKEAINKFAKQNPDLIGENGEKLYNIRISKDAMEYNYFSPYRDNQIEAKVANVFSCTFVIYAVDVNGCTRYYIGIE